MKGQKPLPPFGLDMPFDEALRRFIKADPKELAEEIEAEKAKRGTPKRPPPVGVKKSPD
ncbi:MAG: hypothetical protein ABFC42_12490 [Sulfuricella sp.]